MRRGQVAGGGDLDQGIGEAAAHGLRQRSRAGEQAGAGHRGERHRDLQLGVIVAAGVLEGLGPAVVEDVFAARMALHVAGRGAEQSAVGASARRWRGCQPVRPPTENDASSDDKKSCVINGLSTFPRVDNSGDKLSSDVSLTADPNAVRPLASSLPPAQASQAAAGTSASDWAMRMRSSMSVIGEVCYPDFMPEMVRSSALLKLRPGSRAQALENHLVGPARGGLPVGFGPHGPGQQRQAEDGARRSAAPAAGRSLTA